MTHAASEATLESLLRYIVRQEMRLRELEVEAMHPVNIDAEKTILGAILLDNAAHAEVVGIIKSDDFSLESHQCIFLRMTELIAESTAVDIVTLANRLRDLREIDSIGGVAYLASLTEGLPRRPVIGDYLKIVREKSKLRKIIAVCAEATEKCEHHSETASQIITAMGVQLKGLKK